MAPVIIIPLTDTTLQVFTSYRSHIESVKGYDWYQLKDEGLTGNLWYLESPQEHAEVITIKFKGIKEPVTFEVSEMLGA